MNRLDTTVRMALGHKVITPLVDRAYGFCNREVFWTIHRNIHGFCISVPPEEGYAQSKKDQVTYSSW